MPDPLRLEPWCSFCGKEQQAVRRLIPAPRPELAPVLKICDECVLSCMDTLRAEDIVDIEGWRNP